MSVAKELIRKAIQSGATLSDFLGEYAKKNTERDQALIAKAREEHVVEGELEIDDTTICSGTDDGGDYVLAWVWVEAP